MDKYMEEAIRQSEMSTCLRRKVGAVVVKDDKIIAKGYNNQVGGIRPCTEIGCIRDNYHLRHGERRELCRYICAEQVIISEAARRGESLDGGVIYITSYPCSICVKMLVSAGIKKIVCGGSFEDELTLDFVKEVGIPIIKYN